MKKLDHRKSPWLLPVLFAAVLFYIERMGDLLSRDLYSYQVAGALRQAAVLCLLLGLVLGAVGRRPRFYFTPAYWVLLLPCLLFSLVYLFAQQTPFSEQAVHWLTGLFPSGDLGFSLFLPSFSAGFLLSRGSLAPRAQPVFGYWNRRKAPWLALPAALFFSIVLIRFDHAAHAAALGQASFYDTGLPHFLKLLTIALLLGLAGGLLSALPGRRFQVCLCLGALLTCLLCLMPVAIPLLYYHLFPHSSALFNVVELLFQVFRSASYLFWALGCSFAAGRLLAAGLWSSAVDNRPASKPARDKKDPLENMGWQRLPLHK